MPMSNWSGRQCFTNWCSSRQKFRLIDLRQDMIRCRLRNHLVIDVLLLKTASSSMNQIELRLDVRNVYSQVFKMLLMVHREALLPTLTFVFSFRHGRGSVVMRIFRRVVSFWLNWLIRRVAYSQVFHFLLKLLRSLNPIVYISLVLLYYFVIIIWKLSYVLEFIGLLLDFPYLLKEIHLMPWHFGHLFVHAFYNLLVSQALG